MRNYLSVCVCVLLFVAGNVATAQNISDVLNALQDRNAKVEELRKKRFDEWKSVYAAMLAKSSYASPGEVNPGKWQTDLDKAHTDWGNGVLTLQDLNNLNEEYGYLFGGLNNIAEDGSVQYLRELVVVPAVQLYHEYTSLFEEAAAPAYPSAADISNDPGALKKWHFAIAHWMGGHLTAQNYEEYEIDWEDLAESSGDVTETQIEELTEEELVTVLAQAGVEFDRIKKEYLNVTADEVRDLADAPNAGSQSGQNPSILGEFAKFDDASLPGYGAITNVSMLPSLAYGISRLQVLPAYVKIDGVRFLIGDGQSAGSFPDNISAYNIDGYPWKVGDLQEEDGFTVYDFNYFLYHQGVGNNFEDLYGGFFDDLAIPRASYEDGFLFNGYLTYEPSGDVNITPTCGFVANSARNAVFYSGTPSTETIEQSGLPQYSVGSLTGGEIITLVRIESETYSTSFTPFTKYIGWRKAGFTNHSAADFHNGRVSGSISSNNPNGIIFDTLTYSSIVRPVWIPAFSDAGLSDWEDMVVSPEASPVGQWQVHSSGPYRFTLDLGQGSDLRSRGMLVIRARHGDKGSDMAFHDALEFVGSSDDFEVVRNETSLAYPMDLNTFESQNDGWNKHGFIVRWNQPRLESVQGERLAVGIVENGVLSRTISLYKVVNGTKVGSAFNTLTIKNQDAQNTIPAIATDGIRKWEISETAAFEKKSVIRYLDEDTDQWEVTTTSDAIVGNHVITSGYSGGEITHTIQDRGETRTVTDTDFAVSVDDALGARDPRRLSSAIAVTGGTSTSYTYHTLDYEDYGDNEMKCYPVNKVTRVADTRTNSVTYDKYGRMKETDPHGEAVTSVTYTGAVSTTEVKLGSGVARSSEVTRDDMFTYSMEMTPTGGTVQTTETKLCKTNDANKLKFQPESVNNTTTGVITTYKYDKLGDGAIKITKDVGIGSITAVTRGTRVITETNKFGYLVSQEVKDIESGVVLNSYTAGGEKEDWGQPKTYTDHLGLEESADYDDVTGVIKSSSDKLDVSTVYTLEAGKFKSVRDGLTKEVDYTAAKKTVNKVSGANITTRSLTQDFDDYGHLTLATLTGATSGTVTPTDGNGSLSIKNTTYGNEIQTDLTKNADGVVTAASGSTYPDWAEPGITVSATANGIERVVTQGPATVKTVMDGTGFPVEVTAPASDGTQKTTTNEYEFLADGAVRTIENLQSGAVYIRERYPYKDGGAIERRGIDLTGNEELDSGDRYIEIKTEISAGKITTTTKLSEDNGLREIRKVEFTIATGATVTTLNEGEEVITRTPDYSMKTLDLDSSSGWEQETTMNDLWQPTNTQVTGPGIPAVDIDITYLPDGSMSAVSSSVGNAVTSAGIGEDGLLATLTLPGLNGNVLGGHGINNGEKSITVNGTTYTSKLDGTESAISGTEVLPYTRTLDESGGNIEETISPGTGSATKLITNAAGAQTSKDYDAAGADTTSSWLPGGLLNTYSVARGGNVQLLYTSDGAYDLEKIQFPAAGSPGFPAGSLVEHIFGYDTAGRPDEISDASGDRILTYDKGRLDDTDWTSGYLNAYKVDRSHDASGRLSGITLLKNGQTIHTITPSYNGSSDEISGINATGFSSTYQRNAARHITGITRGSVVQSWGRGTAGRITSADNNTTVAGAPEFDYNTFDTRGRRKDAVTAGGTWSYTYGPAGQLVEAKHISGQPSVHPSLGTFTYSFDGIGRRSDPSNNNVDSLNQFLGMAHAQQKKLYIAADPASRLWVNGNEMTPFDGGLTYSLTSPGPGGGWVSWHVEGVLEGAGDAGAGPDAKAEFSGLTYIPPDQENFTYDADGNRESSALWNYHWDGRNRLVGARTKNHLTDPQGWDVTFDYDAEGRRFKKNVKKYKGGTLESETHTTFVYDGWDLLYEIQANAQGTTLLERKYVWGNDISGSHGGAGGAGGLLLIRESRGGTTEDYYPLFDGSGHLVALADSNGTLQAEYAYGPFGELIHAKGPKAAANPWRYATKYFDAETGLYYYGHRYFDPTTGQWLSREPLGESESLNLYAMTGNDPINKVDRLGLDAYEFFDTVGGAIAGLFLGTIAQAPEDNQFVQDLIEDGQQSEREKRLRLMTICGLAAQGRLELGTAPHFFTEAEVLAIGPRPGGPSMGPATVNPQDIGRHGPQMSPASKWHQAYTMNNCWNFGNTNMDADTAIRTGNANVGIFLNIAAWEIGGSAFTALKSSDRLNRLNNAFSTQGRLLGAGKSNLNWSPYDPRFQRTLYDDALSTTVPPLGAKNVRLAGSRHPVTGIVFDNRGYPIFDDIVAFDTTIGNAVFRSSSYTQQMQLATRDLWKNIESGVISRSRFNAVQLGQIRKGAVKIDGFTWHHHQHTGRMQLVPYDIHSKTGHIGWEGISIGR